VLRGRPRGVPVRVSGGVRRACRAVGGGHPWHPAGVRDVGIRV